MWESTGGQPVACRVPQQATSARVYSSALHVLHATASPVQVCSRSLRGGLVGGTMKREAALLLNTRAPSLHLLTLRTSCLLPPCSGQHHEACGGGRLLRAFLQEPRVT